MSRSNTLFIINVCILFVSSEASTLRVPEDYSSIQACIDAAVSGHDICLVAPGTYHETIDFLGKGVILKSSDGAGATTIDATGLNNSVVTCMNSEGADTVLDGFTITGGTGNNFIGKTAGGGMFNYNSSPTVVNCVFLENTATEGGGMDNYILSFPRVTNCSFIRNYAPNGGGMLNLESRPNLINCTFEGNTAGLGGGMESLDEIAPIMFGCVFHGNHAYLGGAIYNDEDANTVLVNCTFSENWADVSGGAVYNEAGTQLTVDQCLFQANSAGQDGGGIYDSFFTSAIISNSTFDSNRAPLNGGAIFNQFSSFGTPVVIENCNFSRNQAMNGGGIYNDGSGSIQLSHCTFNSNIASEDGGGIENDGDVTLTDCTFTYNAARGGGGFFDKGTTSISDCEFSRNVADDNGGGFSTGYNTLVWLKGSNCTFADNKATNSGGGLFLLGENMHLSEFEFEHNSSTNGGGMALFGDGNLVSHFSFLNNSAIYEGGGASVGGDGTILTDCTFRENSSSLGGGVYKYYKVNFMGCIFTANTAYEGGGIFNDFQNLEVSYCKFLGNSAQGEGGGLYTQSGDTSVLKSIFVGNSADMGGAVYNDSTSNLELSECTISANTAATSGGAFFGEFAYQIRISGSILWSDAPAEIDADGAMLSVQFSDVMGGLPVETVDGGGNVDVDPMFLRAPNPGPDGTWDAVNDDFGDLRLQATSPCVNTGDPAFVPQAGETDLDGHARVLCGRVDMGAYEFGIGDYDCDQAVDDADFARWQSCASGPSTDAIGSEPACAAFDFDNDRDVDLSDFAQLENIIQY